MFTLRYPDELTTKEALMERWFAGRLNYWPTDDDER
ncbi:protein of unknown function [Burkholderia multivorans]